MNKRTIVFGSDHGGFALKEALKTFLKENDAFSEQYVIDDVGAIALDEKDDYPQYAFKTAEQVVAPNVPEESLGILCCRSGGGMVIAANKVFGARAVQVFSVDQARHARQHNNTNILSLAADELDIATAQNIVSAFIETPFSAQTRHQRRLDQITEYEQQHQK